MQPPQVASRRRGAAGAAARYGRGTSVGLLPACHPPPPRPPPPPRCCWVKPSAAAGHHHSRHAGCASRRPPAIPPRHRSGNRPPGRPRSPPRWRRCRSPKRCRPRCRRRRKQLPVARHAAADAAPALQSRLQPPKWRRRGGAAQCASLGGDHRLQQALRLPRPLRCRPRRHPPPQGRPSQGRSGCDAPQSCCHPRRSACGAAGRAGQAVLLQQRYCSSPAGAAPPKHSASAFQFCANPGVSTAARCCGQQQGRACGNTQTPTLLALPWSPETPCTASRGTMRKSQRKHASASRRCRRRAPTSAAPPRPPPALD